MQQDIAREPKSKEILWKEAMELNIDLAKYAYFSSMVSPALIGLSLILLYFGFKGIASIVVIVSVGLYIIMVRRLSVLKDDLIWSYTQSKTVFGLTTDDA